MAAAMAAAANTSLGLHAWSCEFSLTTLSRLDMNPGARAPNSSSKRRFTCVDPISTFKVTGLPPPPCALFWPQSAPASV